MSPQRPLRDRIPRSRTEGGCPVSLRCRTLGVLSLVALTWCPGSPSAPPVRGAEATGLQPPSWEFVPAEATFYGAMLRNREQVQAIAGSRAAARLKALPAYQMAWQMVQAQLAKPDGPGAAWQRFYADPENRQLVELLGDLLSDEVFFCGGGGLANVADLWGKATGMARQEKLYLKMSKAGGDANKAQIQTILDTLAENTDLIQVPEMLIGFRLTKPDAAEAQLTRLEKILGAVLSQSPGLKAELRRTAVANGRFLTLTIDGQAVPWDRIPVENWEDTPGQYKPLLDKLRSLKLVVALGVRDGYFLVSFGSSTSPITQLRSGNSLGKRSEFKRLSAHLEKRLTSVNYVSAALRSRLALSKADVDEMVKTTAGFVNGLGLPEGLRKQIQQDLSELGRDVKSFLRKPGAFLSCSFLTDRGQEGYQYDWSEHSTGEAPRPLTLLDHVGGDPILAIVGRSQRDVAVYRLIVKWMRVANRYFEELALPNFSDEQKQKYEEVTKWLYPLLARFDNATANMLLPALREGQAGFVLDAKEVNRRWLTAMPPAERALPLLAPAFVLGVSDAGLLRKAGEEYRQIANESLAKLKEFAGPFFPEVTIPPPESRQVDSGTLYYYALPAQFGLDKALLPNLGLSDHVLCLSLTADHSTRLLRTNPLKVDGGPLADLHRPGSSSMYFSWPPLVDAVVPWVEYGLRASRIRGDADAKSGGALADLEQQVRQVGEILKALHGSTSVSYVDGDVRVTHSETVIHDLP